MKLKSIARLVIFFSLPFFFTSCGYKWECPGEPIKEDKFSPLVQNQTETKAQEIEPKIVRIKFDGTPSMQGFVTIPDSQYISVLDLIDNSVTRTFNNVKTEYYRFGTKSELLQVSNSQIAQNSNFYSGSNFNFLDANFNVALTPLDQDSSDELTIIVTDLYQEISDQEDPILTTLKTKYLQKGLAIGVVTLKSEFNGTVYDIGKEKQRFPYRSSSDYKTFHPFYLIVLGTDKNIEKYFNKLKESNLIKEQDKLVIFSNNLVKESITLNINSNQNNQSLPKGITREFSLNDGNVVVEATKPEITEFLSISGNSDPLPYNNVSYNPTPYTLPIKLNIIPDILRFYDVQKEMFIEPNDKNLLEFEQAKITQNEINFTVDANNINNPGVYTLVYKLIPESLEEPTWWSEWNFESASSFDGSKTYELLPFLEGLRDITIQSKPTIGYFCYGIWKKE